jgi:hypothetical protein
MPAQVGIQRDTRRIIPARAGLDVNALTSRQGRPIANTLVRSSLYDNSI